MALAQILVTSHWDNHSSSFPGLCFQSIYLPSTLHLTNWVNLLEIYLSECSVPFLSPSMFTPTPHRSWPLLPKWGTKAWNYFKQYIDSVLILWWLCLFSWVSHVGEVDSWFLPGCGRWGSESMDGRFRSFLTALLFLFIALPSKQIKINRSLIKAYEKLELGDDKGAGTVA